MRAIYQAMRSTYAPSASSSTRAGAVRLSNEDSELQSAVTPPPDSIKLFPTKATVTVLLPIFVRSGLYFFALCRSVLVTCAFNWLLWCGYECAGDSESFSHVLQDMVRDRYVVPDIGFFLRLKQVCGQSFAWSATPQL